MAQTPPDLEAISAQTSTLPPPVSLTASATGEGATNLSRPDFVKAIWVDAVGPALRSPEGVKAMVYEVRDAGFDSIYVQVRAYGDAFYESELVPRARNIAANFDPLKAVLEEVRKGDKPLKVHAVLVPLRVWNKRLSAADERHISVRHPEWLTETADGKAEVGDDGDEIWLDPGLTEVHDHIAQVVAELARNYELDGIQIDRLRYPDVTRRAGYNAKAIERFQQETSAAEVPSPADEGFNAWRRAQITALLQKAGESARQARPGIQVTATGVTFGVPPKTLADYRAASEPYTRVFGDWVDWCDKGLIDALVLNNFKAGDTRAGDYRAWMDFAAANKSGVKMVIGVGGWLNDPKYALAMTMEPILIPAADGVALYGYHRPAKEEADRASMLSMLAQVFDPAVLEPKARDLAALRRPGADASASAGSLSQMSATVFTEMAPPPPADTTDVPALGAATAPTLGEVTGAAPAAPALSTATAPPPPVESLPALSTALPAVTPAATPAATPVPPPVAASTVPPAPALPPPALVPPPPFEADVPPAPAIPERTIVFSGDPAAAGVAPQAEYRTFPPEERRAFQPQVRSEDPIVVPTEVRPEIGVQDSLFGTPYVPEGPVRYGPDRARPAGSGAAASGSVRLTNGQIINGRIIDRTPTIVRVEMSNGSTLALPASKVAD